MLIKMINQIFGIVEIEFILIAKRYIIALIAFNAAQENIDIKAEADIIIIGQTPVKVCAAKSK